MKEFLHLSADEVYLQKRDHYHELGFIVDGRRVGTAGLVYRNLPFPFYHLAFMDIVQEERGLGHGRDLLLGVNAFLDRRGKCGILINSIPVENPAHNMYGSHGWAEIERKPFWYIYNPPKNLSPDRIARAVYEIEHM